MKRRNLILVFFVLNIYSTVCQTNLLKELEACFPFNGSPNDASGNGNHGGLQNGPTLVEDRFGRPNGAYYFNGTSAFIELNPNHLRIENYTYSMWVKPGKIPSGSAPQYLLTVGSSNGGQSISLQNNNEFIGFTAGGDLTKSNSVYCTKGSAPILNTWYHLVLIKDNAGYQFYENGKLICNKAASSPPSYGSEAAKSYIAVNLTGKSSLFNGTIDDIHIYRRAITAIEVKSLFEGEKQPEIELKTDNVNPCAGDKVVYTIKGASETANFQWKFNTTKKETYNNFYEFTTEKSAKDYTLEVNVEIIDDASCFPQKPKKASTKYNVRSCRELSNINIPNIFSPNGDGINDFWEIDGLSHIPEATVAIYDRSGTLIFFSMGYEKPWDGKVNGHPIEEGVCEFVISTNINSEKAIKGALVIVR